MQSQLFKRVQNQLKIYLYSRQSIRSVSSSNSRRSIELNDHRVKENARLQVKLSKITSTFERQKKQSPRASRSTIKLEKIKQQPISQEKSLNVKPITNYKYYGSSIRHKSLHQPQKEEKQLRNIISQYQSVLDQILPMLKQGKFQK